MNLESSDIAKLLKHWLEAKNEIIKLEKKIEKYKSVANRVMNQQNTNVLTDNKIKIKRKEISRTTISKQDVPKDMWVKYARPCSYKAYYLSENNN